MNKKAIIISVILLVVLTALYIPKEFQNDTFYLIKVGESLVKNGIDFIDHFSFHNLPYLYPHFLFSIVVYLVYSIFSLNGLYVLTILFSLLLVLIIYYINIKNSNNKIIPLILTIVFIMYISGFMTLRAQIISYTIFVLEYYFLNKLLSTNKNKYIIYIFLLAILLVNTHVAVYPFYIIMFLPFYGEYIIKKILKKETFKVKKITIALLLSLISGLISPLFFNSYTYLYNTLINNTTIYIEEHQPTILFKDLRMILLSLTVIILFTNKSSKLEIKEKLLLLGLTFMAFTSQRHQSLLLIFTIIILNKSLNNIISKNVKEKLLLIEQNIIKPKYFITSLLLIIILSIPMIINNFNSDYINKEKYPVLATKYIKENLDYQNIRLFNDINIGSYLMLNDIKVFIDSRTDLYTSSYNKKEDIYDSYINAIYLKTYYENIFDFYNIDYVLLPNDSSLLTYISYGNKNSIYTIEYKDDNFTIYKRSKCKT